MKTCKYCKEEFSNSKHTFIRTNSEGCSGIRDDKFTIVHNIRLRSQERKPNTWCSLWCQEHDILNRAPHRIQHDIIFYLDEIDRTTKQMEQTTGRIVNASINKDAFQQDLYMHDAVFGSNDYWCKEVDTQIQIHNSLVGKLEWAYHKLYCCKLEMKFNSQKDTSLTWRH